MQWHIVLAVVRQVAVRLIPGLLAGLVALLLDAQLLDAGLAEALVHVLSAL